jgi:hypothetical protein
MSLISPVMSVAQIDRKYKLFVPQQEAPTEKEAEAMADSMQTRHRHPPETDDVVYVGSDQPTRNASNTTMLDLQYRIDDVPPWYLTIVLGFQVRTKIRPNIS